ncbi:hypothetical protein HGRIS_012287 [Hohenbuehelia grisea]|uniref:Calcium uniporter protein, mitochondrial n=1 Tax=Hohenbuehelia grisea TaxID=104357 RepID=A0ABR3IRR9_9AGAR
MNAFLFVRTPTASCSSRRLWLTLSRRTAIPTPRFRHAPSSQSFENTNVGHSSFLAEASPGQKWKQKDQSGGFAANGSVDPKDEDFESLTEGKGKLSPTSSHLFKLILPLDNIHRDPKHAHKHSPGGAHSTATTTKKPLPIVLLLHPSQPLSHVSRLILASLAPSLPSISFRSTSPRGQEFQWSDSTDVGDFIRDAARAAKFCVCITYDHEHDGDTEAKDKPDETVIDVEVPTFADRTRFLRRRLATVQGRLKDMEGLKRECDREAHRGARRMAISGFGMLLVYWGLVARLTFWDLGWDVMEPITYLSGLSTVICGYLWFLYQGREVSYTSVLDRSVSQRREALYKSRGLDIDLWVDLVSEDKAIKREIRKIAEDYDDAREDDAEDDDEGKGKDQEGKKPLPPPEPDTDKPEPDAEKEDDSKSK